MEKEDGGWAILGAAILLVIVLAITVNATVGWSEIGASWVQAVGSVLALAVAILVPARMRAAERKDRKEEAINRAFVKAMSVLVKATAMQSVIEGFVADVQMVGIKLVDVDLNDHWPFVRDFELPTEDEMNAMISLNPSVAADIAQATAYLAMMRNAMDIASKLKYPAMRTSVCVNLLPFAKQIHLLLDRAIKPIRAFADARAPTST